MARIIHTRLALSSTEKNKPTTTTTTLTGTFIGIKYLDGQSLDIQISQSFFFLCLFGFGASGCSGTFIFIPSASLIN